jgi:phosphatidylserine/phosphatidylglycerophosphate/cardiolipin synthase-like enzyme
MCLGDPVKRSFVLFGLATFLLPQIGHASEVLFSPHGGTRDQIIERINRCRSSLDVAMFVFTSTDVAQALVQAHERGVKVRVVRDRSQSNKADDQTVNLQHFGVLVHLITGPGGEGLMHNTFAIFDGKVVYVGSYNWTENAENYNWENAAFIDEKKVVESYLKEFRVLWKVRDLGL